MSYSDHDRERLVPEGPKAAGRPERRRTDEERRDQQQAIQAAMRGHADPFQSPTPGTSNACG